MNTQLIEILFRPATDTRSSGVRLVSHRFPHDMIADGYDHSLDGTFSQGVVILERLGYSIICSGESKKGYWVAVRDFVPLRDAFRCFKAPASALWKWNARFTGRKIGAIGITERVEVQVEAHDMAAARLKLYDTHEHITDLALSKGQEVSK